jgi:hypothetical protein
MVFVDCGEHHAWISVKMCQTNKPNCRQTVRQCFVNLIGEKDIWEEFEASCYEIVFSKDIVLEEETCCLLFRREKRIDG